MEKGKTYELVAPDGGFGYVILFAVFINLTVLSASINCYGIIYKDFFSELDMDSKNVTALSGINAMSSAIASLMTASLLKWLTKRKIAIIGAAMWNLGMICTVFAQSKLVFFIFQGILQNFGQGLIYNISTSILNEYFVKKRTLAISISQTLLAVLCLLAPQFFKWSLNDFGHRSTLIWLCAMSLHMFVGVVLLQPVSWHMKMVEISPKEHELKILLKENTEISTKLKDEDLNNVNLDRLRNDVTEVSTQRKIRNFFNMVDLRLIKTFMLSIECLGATTVMVIEFTFLMILPQALQSYDWTEADIAWAFSLIAMGDLFMRILLIILDKWVNKWGSSSVYVFGILLGFVTRIGILTSKNRVVIYCLMTAMGMSRCILLVVIILLLSETVKPEDFSSAVGIFMTVMGLLSLTLGPLLGAIRDYTDSYTITFYLMIGVLGTVGVGWFFKLIFSCKNRNRDIKRKLNSA